MNLEAFTMTTLESEFHRVVRHETGHTLGFPHEHMRKALVAKIDPAKAIAYFERTQGWSEEEVRAQVLTPIEESTLRGTAADAKSIMCYQILGELTNGWRTHNWRHGHRSDGLQVCDPDLSQKGSLSGKREDGCESHPRAVKPGEHETRFRYLNVLDGLGQLVQRTFRIAVEHVCAVLEEQGILKS